MPVIRTAGSAKIVTGGMSGFKSNVRSSKLRCQPVAGSSMLFRCHGCLAVSHHQRVNRSALTWKANSPGIISETDRLPSAADVAAMSFWFQLYSFSPATGLPVTLSRTVARKVTPGLRAMSSARCCSWAITCLGSRATPTPTAFTWNSYPSGATISL